MTTPKVSIADLTTYNELDFFSSIVNAKESCVFCCIWFTIIKYNSNKNSEYNFSAPLFETLVFDK